MGARAKKKEIVNGINILDLVLFTKLGNSKGEVRRMIKNKFEEIFKEVDLIFMPTTLDQAFEKNRESSDPNRMYKEDLLTIPANLFASEV